MTAALPFTADPKPARGLLQFGDRLDALHAAKRRRFRRSGKPLDIAAAGAGCYHRFMTWSEDLILAVAGTLGMVGFVAQMVWMVALVRSSFGV